MAQASSFGQRVRQYMHMRGAPRSLMTRSLRGVELAATETQDDNPVPGLSGSLADDAYLVSLKLQDYPECELWEHHKYITKSDVRAGTTYLYDLRRDPRYIVNKPFHSIQFYLPQSALDGIAKCFVIWAGVVGAISLEVFGQYGVDTLSDPLTVFDTQMRLLVGVLNQSDVGARPFGVATN